jgi:hypothetical protein
MQRLHKKPLRGRSRERKEAMPPPQLLPAVTEETKPPTEERCPTAKEGVLPPGELLPAVREVELLLKEFPGRTILKRPHPGQLLWGGRQESRAIDRLFRPERAPAIVMTNTEIRLRQERIQLGEERI